MKRLWKIQQRSVHGVTRAPKPTERTTPSVNPKVKVGTPGDDGVAVQVHQLSQMCPLEGVLIMGDTLGAQGIRNSPRSPLNFSVNLKVLYKYRMFF